MCKRISALVFALFLILTMFSGVSFASEAAAERMIGDVDGDESITVSDALGLLRFVVGVRNYDEADIPVYDVSGDKKVGVEDAVGVLRTAIRMTPAFGYDGVDLELAPNAAALAYGYTPELFDKAVVYPGNTAKLVRLMEKAEKDENLTVATIGGSITAGSVTSNPTKCYGYRVYEWWCDNFPNSRFRYANKGIGATCSDLGVHRLENDILKLDPDLVIVEFAVNDRDRHFEYYENILRRVLLNNSKTAIIMLFMQDQKAWNVQESEIPAGNHYEIPMISYRDATNPLLESGAIKWSDISPDNIHPNDTGHDMTASLIRSYLDCVKAKYGRLSRVVPTVPEPLYTDRYMNAKLYMGGSIEPKSLGVWKVDNSFNYYHLKGAWTVNRRGKPMTFKKSFAELNLVFRKMASDPNAGTIKVMIDGKQAATVDSAFPNGWGDYLAVQQVFKEDTVKEHEISLVCNGGNFTLCGLMLS